MDGVGVYEMGLLDYISVVRHKHMASTGSRLLLVDDGLTPAYDSLVPACNSLKYRHKVDDKAKRQLRQGKGVYHGKPKCLCGLICTASRGKPSNLNVPPLLPQLQKSRSVSSISISAPLGPLASAHAH